MVSFFCNSLSINVNSLRESVFFPFFCYCLATTHKERKNAFMGEKIKTFLSTKSFGFYVLVASIVLSIVAGVVYAVCYHAYVNYMSWPGFWMFLVGAILGCGFLVFKLDEFAAGANAAGTFAGLCLFIRHIYMYVQNITGGLDVASVSNNFISSVIFIGLAFVVSVVAIFLPKKKAATKEEN